MRTVFALGFSLLPCLVAGCIWTRNMLSRPTLEEHLKMGEEVEAMDAIDTRELRALHEQLYMASKEQVVLTLGQPDPKRIFKEKRSVRLKKGSTYERPSIEDQKTGNHDERIFTERWVYDKVFEADIGDPPRRVRWRSGYNVYFLDDKVVLVR